MGKQTNKKMSKKDIDLASTKLADFLVNLMKNNPKLLDIKIDSKKYD